MISGLGGGGGGVGSAALRAAASTGDTAACARLLGSSRSVRFSRDELGRSALHLAASAGHAPVVRLLLSVAAPREVDSPDGAGCTGLQRAAADGHEEVVRLLLARGADVDHQDSIHGNCALHEAAWKGYSRTVALLATAGANLCRINAGGFTALHLCCQNGHNQSCRELLLASCNPDLQNNYGDTALHTAARYGHAGVTRILISAKCRVCEQNKNGDTALHIAAAMGRRKLTRILLEAGCDKSVRNKQNESARDIALRKDLNEILFILDEAPGKKDKKCKTRKRSKSKVTFDGKKVEASPIKSKNWSPYGCHYYPDPEAFPSPRLDTLPDEPLKRGEQYYLDLSGNICKGPVGVGYTCYCAPLFRHLEARLEKDKKDLQRAQVRLGQRVAGLEQRLVRSGHIRRSERACRDPQPMPASLSRSRSLEMLDKVEEGNVLQTTRSMDELDQPDDGNAKERPSVKELVARIQQQSGTNNSDNSESSDDDDSSPMRTLQDSSNPNYENVSNGPPRSRVSVYSPEPNPRVYTSSACIPIQTVGFSAPPNYYEPNINTRFAKLRVLDSSKNDPGANKISRTQDAIDRDTNNDSGYSTKVYGSSKGNSPCLSGQTENDCMGNSSLV